MPASEAEGRHLCAACWKAGGYRRDGHGAEHKEQAGACKIYSGVLNPMPRGYRYIVLAAFGWLVLSASPAPDQSAKAQRPEAAENVQHSFAAATTAKTHAIEMSEPRENHRPCNAGESDRTSDLCAQWEATVAARDSATWAFWSVLLGIAGTVGLLLNLYYARRAVLVAESATADADNALKIAERNAVSAERQVANSEKTAQLQLRAYVNIAGIQVVLIKSADSLEAIRAHLLLQNSGSTPAVVKYAVINCMKMPYGSDYPVFQDSTITSFDVELGSGQSSAFGITEIDRYTLTQMTNEVIVMYAQAAFAYEDIFGKTYYASVKLIVKPRQNFIEHENAGRWIGDLETPTFVFESIGDAKYELKGSNA